MEAAMNVQCYKDPSTSLSLRHDSRQAVKRPALTDTAVNQRPLRAIWNKMPVCLCRGHFQMLTYNWEARRESFGLTTTAGAGTMRTLSNISGQNSNSKLITKVWHLTAQLLFSQSFPFLLRRLQGWRPEVGHHHEKLLEADLLEGPHLILMLIPVSQKKIHF